MVARIRGIHLHWLGVKELEEEYKLHTNGLKIRGLIMITTKPDLFCNNCPVKGNKDLSYGCNNKELGNLDAEIAKDFGLEIGVEYAFPKPFCSLEAFDQPVLEKFIRQYKIGKPKIEVEVKNNIISQAFVLTSAPCGSTWYITQCLKGKNKEEIEEVVAVAHHSYPCTASMEIDAELNDAILHKAGCIIREAVKKAITKTLIRK